MYEYNCNIVKVVDGDTVDVDIDLGFGMVYKKQRVRMMGIDTPESRTRDLEEKFYGKQSKYHLEKLLSEQNVQLQSYDKGKFGRILGELFIGDNPLSVNQQMIQACHAVPYFGQSKEDTEKGHMWNREMLIQEGIIYNKNLER